MTFYFHCDPISLDTQYCSIGNGIEIIYCKLTMMITAAPTLTHFLCVLCRLFLSSDCNQIQFYVATDQTVIPMALILPIVSANNFQ